MKTIYGLIGRPLGHSFSADYFNKKFRKEGIDAEYRLFPLEKISDLKKLIAENPDIKGLNVTIPYKKSVLPLVSRQNAVVQKTGAANTLKIVDGELWAYNTDVAGFELMLEKIKDRPIESALVAGTGGAAMAVAYVLRKHGIHYTLISRTTSCLAIPYGMVDQRLMDANQLIINATPVGMYPGVDAIPPLPFNLFNEKHTVIDLIYNPAETRLLQEARQRGARTLNGLTMLHRQAEAAWEIWAS